VPWDRAVVEFTIANKFCIAMIVDGFLTIRFYKPAREEGRPHMT
jgi:hypothetical protein